LPSVGLLLCVGFAGWLLGGMESKPLLGVLYFLYQPIENDAENISIGTYLQHRVSARFFIYFYSICIWRDAQNLLQPYT
jgi:hypothetical protein